MNKKSDNFKNGNYIIENKEKLLNKRKHKKRLKRSSVVIHNYDIYIDYTML